MIKLSRLKTITVQLFPLILIFTRGARKRINRRKLKCWLATNKPVNIIIGSGSITIGGWFSTDKDILDITLSNDWERCFIPGSIDRMLAEHVFEHLTEQECKTALAECFRFLRKNGLLRIAVPDGYRKDPEYFSDVAPPKDGHKQLFTVDTFVPLLESCGFQVTPLEYFDADGKFNIMSWDVQDGFIRRSIRFGKQARYNDNMYYTSLIVDARKP